VQRGISMMSEAEQRDPAWRYWSARALVASHPADGATPAADRVMAQEKSKAIMQQVANTRDGGFYAQLAAESLGSAMPPNFAMVVPDEAAVQSVATRQAVKRALALFRLVDLAEKPAHASLRNDALREWRAALRGMDDATLLAAAELARRHDIPDRAINTAERTQSMHDFAVRYPVPYREKLEAASRQNGLDVAWVYGLIRQESRFMVDAKSWAGAKGLMQLMPATAQWAAKQLGMKDYSLARVADIPTNISLGAFYLKHVLDDLGHQVLATAAYNAGPGRARRWRADVPLEGAIYAESIPFNETRDYVKQVFLNKWFYGHRLNGKSLTLTELLGTVPSRLTPGASSAPRTSSVASTAPSADVGTAGVPNTMVINAAVTP
jgi:soluble lytic murein transglycosylase